MEEGKSLKFLTLHPHMGIVFHMKSDLVRAQKARRLYVIIAIGCIMFVILTLVAMLTYTGGWVNNHAVRGYSFTHNFLMNLGMLTALSGKANWISAALFFVALGGAGACPVIFFIIFPRFFQHTHL
jgi:hypothetical protein